MGQNQSPLGCVIHCSSPGKWALGWCWVHQGRSRGHDQLGVVSTAGDRSIVFPWLPQKHTCICLTHQWTVVPSDNACPFYKNKGTTSPTFYFTQRDIHNSNIHIKVKNIPNSFQIVQSLTCNLQSGSGRFRLCMCLWKGGVIRIWT